MITVAILTVMLTILFVLVFSRITGISTGVGPPIVLRTLAGSVAAALLGRLFSRRS